MSSKSTPLLDADARLIAKLATGDDYKVLSARADIEAEMEALRDQRDAAAKRLRELYEVARTYDERVHEILTAREERDKRACTVRSRTYLSAGGSADFAISLDDDGCVVVNRMVDTHDFAGQTTHAPAPSDSDDNLTDEEFEDMVSQVQDHVLSDMRLHPFARLIRPVPGEDMSEPFHLPDASPGPGYADVAVIDQEAG